MANGRNPGKKRDTGRDPGSFAAIPFMVLDSIAYMNLSPTAKALLVEVARQYVPKKGNNGSLLLSRNYLTPRGWYSAQAIQDAKAELLDNGFIFETVKGHRPNRASWYAMTWRELDKNSDYDAGAVSAFVRCAYLLAKTKSKRKQPESLRRANLGRSKNAALILPHRTGEAPIGLPHRTGEPPTVLPHRPISPGSGLSSVLLHRNHLDLPVCGAQDEGAPAGEPSVSSLESAGGAPEPCPGPAQGSPEAPSYVRVPPPVSVTLLATGKSLFPTGDAKRHYPAASALPCAVEAMP